MMQCKEASHLVSQALDRPLGPGERLRLRLHLFICHYCNDFSRQLSFLRRSARQAAKQNKPH